MIQKLGKNDICHCGSGLKYKRCCLKSGRLSADREPSNQHVCYYSLLGRFSFKSCFNKTKKNAQPFRLFVSHGICLS